MIYEHHDHGKANGMLDFAIVGVARSGTTSLFRWLAAHPETQGSDPKETHYFVDRGNPFFKPSANFIAHDWDGFQRFFASPRAGRKRFEATAISLFQETARCALAGIDPQPLVVVALRCPAEQIRSLFYWAQNNAGVVDSSVSFPTFVSALLSGDLDSIGPIFRNDRIRWYLGSTLSTNRYVEWLDRWREHFPAERVVIVDARKLSDCPRQVVTNISSRIGIDPAFYEDYEFKRFNATNANSRTRTIAQLMLRVMPEGRARAKLARVYRKLPSGRSLGSASAEDMAALQALGEYFQPFNRALGDRYSVDTSDWWSR